MLSSHIMVVMIIIVVATASVLKARYNALGARERAAENGDEARLKEELKMLRDRLAVLERIATEKEHSLAQEIDRLRDR